MEKSCSKCGEIIEDAKDFCPNCGSSLTQQRKKTGKPIAGGILLIIAACFSLVTGLLYLFGVIASGIIASEFSYTGLEPMGLLYLGIGAIFSIWAFAIGLAGAIYSIKRTHFGIAITGASFVIVAACITIFFYFISIPVLILGILSAVFIAASKKEFIVA